MTKSQTTNQTKTSSTDRQSELESAASKQQFAKQLDRYVTLNTPADRIQYFQKALHDANTDYQQLTNRIAYIFPKTSSYDFQYLVNALSKADDRLFSLVKPKLLDRTNPYSAYYDIKRGFHLLGRQDSKDYFEVQLEWNFLSDKLLIKAFASDEAIAKQLSRINRDIDGSNRGNSQDESATRSQLLKLQGVLSFLNHLDNLDDAEANKLKKHFVENRTIAAPINYDIDPNQDKQAWDLYSDRRDFIDDLRHDTKNYVNDGGFLSKSRERTRMEAINALFDGRIDTESMKSKYSIAIDDLRDKLSTAKSEAAANVKAQSSAIALVRAKESEIINGIQKQVQQALDKLANGKLILPIKLEVIDKSSHK